MKRKKKMITSILKDDFPVEKTNNLIYDFLKKNNSSIFYDELFSETFNTPSKPDLWKKTKTSHQQTGNSYRIMNQIISYLEDILDENSIVIELGGGIYQNRSANAYKRFKNYFPFDISKSSIERYCRKYDKIGLIGDAKELPFKDGSIDCIFTHTFLEHPLEPEKVLNEICRVLKSGGVIVHNDAWFCRWWQRFGVIGLKSFRNMALKEKFIFFTAKITEFKAFRIPPIIIKRCFNAFFQKTNTDITLSYKKLKPNYSLHLGCDEDAANSIDPIDVVRFYESRGFCLDKELSFIERVLYPNRFIILHKGKTY